MEDKKLEIDRLQVEIDRKRAVMIDSVKQFGMHSEQALKASTELDDLITEYMKRHR